jgi:hypothetical protein
VHNFNFISSTIESKNLFVFLYGMHPVVCQDIANRAVYTIKTSNNVNKENSILIYHHSFIMQRCSSTCFDLQEDIIRCNDKNSVLVFQLYFNMDTYYYNFFVFDTEYYLIVEYI